MARKQNKDNVPRESTANAHRIVNEKFHVVNEPEFPAVKKLAFLLAIFSFIVYANTLSNGYALDDISSIVRNDKVTKGVAGLPEIFSTPYSRLQANLAFYRPLSLAMFAVEYHLFGDNPAAGHFFNVLFFAMSVVLLFLFLDRLFERKKTTTAFLASLLFAVHPIHTEVVANIKSRDELLCFFFGFLSLNLYMKYIDGSKMKTLLWGMLCLFLSLVSKETSISFLAVVPLVFFFYINENKKRSRYITLSTLVVTVVYIGVRTWVIYGQEIKGSHAYNFVDNMLLGAPSTEARIATAISILGHYLRLLFVPYPLLCDYSYSTIPFVNFSKMCVLVSLVVYIFLAFFGVYRLLTKTKDIIAFAVLFFLITLSLFSNIFFLLGSTMAERFLFFASAGFCIAVAVCLEKVIVVFASKELDLPSINKLWIVPAIIVLVFSAITFNRNKDWADNYTLFKTDRDRSPNNCRLYSFYGDELINNIYQTEQNVGTRQSIVNEGVASLQRAVAIFPGYANAHSVLAQAFYLAGKLDSMEEHYKIAFKIDPRNLEASNNLTSMSFSRSNFREALNITKKSLAYYPDDDESYRKIGLCYLQLKVYDSAIMSYRRAISLNQENVFAIEGMALVYNATGKTDSALTYEVIARRSDINFKLPQYIK